MEEVKRYKEIVRQSNEADIERINGLYDLWCKVGKNDQMFRSEVIVSLAQEQMVIAENQKEQVLDQIVRLVKAKELYHSVSM